jgi:Sigma-70 region 2
MDDWLTERFQENRPHLRAVAYRMLGSQSEADDAVQESWLRVSRAGRSDVENLTGWLTTVVARVWGERRALPSNSRSVITRSSPLTSSPTRTGCGTSHCSTADGQSATTPSAGVGVMLGRGNCSLSADAERGAS